METIDIESLRFDDKNFNKHTEFGMSLLERSLRENGAGRSVLVDKNNNLIAGNGIVEAAVAAGFKRVKIVDTDGETLVAVRRPDLELDTAAGRKMALADNATAAANLEWDTEAIAEACRDFDIDARAWGVSLDFDDGARFFGGERNGERSGEYDEFEEKFKPKLTTDDCYTPTEVYDEVAKYVRNIVGDDPEFVRPFYPNGDYRRFHYPEGCVVVDNPPFSIYAEIVRWYLAQGIKFFLFAPALTQVVANAPVNYVVASCNVTYENGAVVRTSFTTNLLGDIAFTTAPGLKRAVEAVNGAPAAELPLYGYENVITPALLCKLALVDFSAKRSDVAEIANLDALKAKGKSLYGRGWLLSERKEKERKENYLHLSDRERDIVKKLNTTGWKEDGE